MADKFKEYDVNKAKEDENKLCAIIYPIATILWMITSGINLGLSIHNGNKVGWDFWIDIFMVVVFGYCAISYNLKCKKDKKAAEE
jgi:hypothetical protein